MSSEDRDYKDPLEDEDPPIQVDFGNHYLRCKCGYLFSISMPCYCECGARKGYWKTDGKLFPLSKMDLGHLTSCIKTLSERLGQPHWKVHQTSIEVALDIFYAELGSRDKEIAQATGIQRALFKRLSE